MLIRRLRSARGSYRWTPLPAALAGLVVLAVSQPTVAQSAEPPAPLRPATVSVDFGARQGKLPRPEKLNNFGNVTASPEQRSADAAYFNEEGLHAKIQRIWLSSPNAPAEENVFNQCSLAASTCDFSPAIKKYLSDASTLADSLLVNLNPVDYIEGKRPIEELEPMVALIVRNLKQQYPAVKYIEVFNEPDWNFYGVQRRMGVPPDETTLQPNELYAFYVPFYQAVNEVNKSVRKADRLQVGGPSLSLMDPKWFEPFLDSYAADTNPGKRLDFLSYHSYLKWSDDYQIPTLYKDDLSQVAPQRGIMQGWLKERRITQHIPSFVTETGIYPGSAFDDREPKNDYLRQATGMATYGYWYADQPDTSMFNWCVRHRVEERKDQLVTRTAGGPVAGTFTPYGNMMLMQSRMKDTRVSAVSHAPLVDGDNGIYAMASTDKSGASLMVWNWQHVHDDSYRATIDMSRLPSELRNGPVRQRMYRIDQTTSNYFTNPATAELQQVDEKIVAPGKSYTETIQLAPNAIYLIVLERA